MAGFVIYFLLSILHLALANETMVPSNSTSPKDMYVVRATVYQVGILVNKTNATDNNMSGRQESITFFHRNGSSLNLGELPAPLLTNVTAESVLGVAPANTTLPWTALRNLGVVPTKPDSTTRPKREVVIPANLTKASLLIPASAGVQSISLPLLSLNNNMTKIPVPIPNVSVVSYTKANTVVRKPFY